MEKLDALFFAPPMFSDGSIPEGRLVNDNLQNKEVPRGIHCIASYLASIGRMSRAVITDTFFSSPITSKETLIGHVNQLIYRKVTEYNPDFIGFSLMFGFTEQMIVEMTRFAKNAFPQKKIVVGGNHATFVAERLLASWYDTGIDIVVRGEGEKVMAEIVNRKKWEDIYGISFRNSAKAIVHNNRRSLEPILDLPANDPLLLDLGEGSDIFHFNHMIQYARGCSFKCSFCTNEMMWGQKIRPHSISTFRKELTRNLIANEKMGGDPFTILFDDDLLASSICWRAVWPLLKEAKGEFPKTRFIGQARVGSVFRDEESVHEKLEQAQRVGFAALYLGIETGSQVILDAMNKRCRREWIELACQNLQRHGIAAGGFWMFGHPGATCEEEKISLEMLEYLLSRELLQSVETHMTIPFPGTRARMDARVRIIIPEEDEIHHHSIFAEHPIHCLINPDDGSIIMSEEDIAGFYREGVQIKNEYLNEGALIVASPSFLS